MIINVQKQNLHDNQVYELLSKMIKSQYQFYYLLYNVMLKFESLFIKTNSKYIFDIVEIFYQYLD